MAEEKETRGRMLGATESLYAGFVENLGASILFQIGVVDTSHELSPDDVREAGRILASRQESLRMKITKTDQYPGYRFEPMENWQEIDVKLANIDTKDSWIHIINEERDRKFDFVRGPLWAIILASVAETGPILGPGGELGNRYIIMMKFHHSICDAKSAFDVLYRQFLPILSAVINKGDPEGVLPHDIPLQVCYEDSLGSAPLPRFLKTILNVGTNMWLKFAKSSSYSFFYKEDPERTKEEIALCPGFYPFVFSEELTTYVLKAAKQHNVSVHCVLTGVASIAFCATCSEAGIKLSKNIKQHWTIDTRKFIGLESPQPLCAYSGTGSTATKNKSNFTNEEFWKMCQDISKGVKSQNVKDKCAFAARVLSCLIEGWSADWDSFLEKFKKMGSGSFANISNLGNCSRGPEPTFTKGEVELCLQEAHFALIGIKEMEIPFFHCITTFNGKIMWNINYAPRFVSDRFVKNLSLKYQEVAEKYCKPQDAEM